MLGATLGCLALGMIHQLSGGAWGVVTRRLFGAASRVLPVLTLLFLPIVVRHARSLRVDARTMSSRPTRSCRQSSVYLNTPFFLVRAAVYFAVWNALAYFLNRGRSSRTAAGDPRIARRMQMLSGGGLVAYALDDHLRVVRLGDVARPALVLDDLRRARSWAARG